LLLLPRSGADLASDSRDRGRTPPGRVAPLPSRRALVRHPGAGHSYRSRPSIRARIALLARSLGGQLLHVRATEKANATNRRHERDSSILREKANGIDGDPYDSARI